MKKISVIIYGSKGRMGKALLECSKEDPRIEIIGAIGSQESIDPILSEADIVIDFTSEEATLALLEKCAHSEKPLLIGTTGLSSKTESKIKETANVIPILFSPNYSVGVNVLFWLTEKATDILGPEYDAEVIEVHHRFKKDAPSGTARHLAEIIADARQLDYEKDTRHGRFGMPGERTSSEIGMHSVRVGDVAGDHTVIFGTLGERLELTYRASSREAFARGALKAAYWLCDKNQPGLYDMRDVLGLK
ncbi:MAG: 4-hydroxy-tetrahydrodipicolinate reductase [Chthoniobacterales bacterium]